MAAEHAPRHEHGPNPTHEKNEGGYPSPETTQPVEVPPNPEDKKKAEELLASTRASNSSHPPASNDTHAPTPPTPTAATGSTAIKMAGGFFGFIGMLFGITAGAIVKSLEQIAKTMGIKEGGGGGGGGGHDSHGGGHDDHGGGGHH